VSKPTKKYPIRLSEWHVTQNMKKPKKPVKHVVKDVMVCSDHDHILVLANSSYYLRKVYKKLFGPYDKTKFKNAWQNKPIQVDRVILDEKTYGMGVGNFDKESLAKYGPK